MHKSRVLPTLFMALGVALLVGGLVAPKFLVWDARLPLTLSSATWTLTDPNGTRGGEPAPVTRQLHMEIREPSDEATVSVRVGDTLRAGDAPSDFENLVTASTWSFQMDRLTGEVLEPADVQLVMAMPEVAVPIEGAWLKFPANVEQRDYEVFDPTLRGTAPAQFVGEEEIEGRAVYTFRQVVAPTNLAQRFADDRNLGFTEDQRTYLFHAAERELLVDQASGLVVGLRESVDDYYADAEGNGLENVVTYGAQTDPEKVSELLKELARLSSPTWGTLASRIAIGAGGILTLAGLAWILAQRRSGGRVSAGGASLYKRTDVV